MERKIGEIFEYKGELYQCVLNTDKSVKNCYRCYASECSDEKFCEVFGKCADYQRSDEKNVIFKKLEKFGGYFYDDKGEKYQHYKTDFTPLSSQDKRVFPQGDSGMILVELKQKQEDMEEKIQHYDCFFDKEKSNLKPFDLEVARNGAPVCTRDGHKARIICFDAKCDTPIIALITTDNGEEITFDYLIDGTFANSENPDNDLMMLPEKKEGWINIIGKSGCDRAALGRIYKSREDAVESAKNNDMYIATVKIVWEE